MPLPSITIEGYIHGAPDLQFGASGKARLTFRLRAGEKGREDGSYGDSLWLNVTLWERDAEAAAELREGEPVTVTGVLYTRQYEKQDGTKGSAIEVKWPRVSRPVRQAQGAPQQQAPTQQWGQQQPPPNDPWAVPTTGQEPPF